ncbi:sensor domain-containing diguanylate cyclase [Salinisphaera hydrothermalis]|uniref:sensor domain-containing diguanylate cyclase n=1 Tax=Salinisphaera hydrothermalis TaxID=563188 RepID=UPI003340DCBA
MSSVMDDCKHGGLHLIGSIQSFGALIAVDRTTRRIDYCSDNIADWLGVWPAVLLGCDAAAVFGAQWPALAELAVDAPRCVSIHLPDGRLATAIGHCRNDRLLLEFEAPPTSRSGCWNESARIDFISRLSNANSSADVAAVITDRIAEFTGYDRVMVYRFLENWDGEVVDQRCAEGVEGFLGLRFPAQDIPENARRLYTVNWQRLIADTETPDAALCTMHADAEPLDLTHSMLRSVHPVHIRYLRNMGVRGSFSVSLIVDGVLWGLVTCHHHEAKHLHAEQRLALEEMARLASLHLANLARLEDATLHSILRERLSVMNRALDPALEDTGAILAGQLRQICLLLDADGVCLRWGGTVYRRGELPEEDDLAALESWLHDQHVEGHCTHFDALPPDLRDRPGLCADAAGVLYLPFGERCDVIAVRKEQVEKITWAGQPPDGSVVQSLSPRHSFAAWSESVRHQAKRWDVAVLRIAEELRGMLAEFLQAAYHKELAYQDPLTGVANRHAFEQAMTDKIEHCERTGERFALHLIDLDRFKPINDTYGHGTGDALLKEIAVLMSALARREDVVARLGGDEFAIMQWHVEDSRDATRLADRVTSVLEQPMVLEGHSIRVGASIGTAIYPDDGRGAKALHEYADAGLYAEKERYRAGSARAGSGGPTRRPVGVKDSR